MRSACNIDTTAGLVSTSHCTVQVSIKLFILLYFILFNLFTFVNLIEFCLCTMHSTKFRYLWFCRLWAQACSSCQAHAQQLPLALPVPSTTTMLSPAIHLGLGCTVPQGELWALPVAGCLTLLDSRAQLWGKCCYWPPAHVIVMGHLLSVCLGHQQLI